MRSGFRIVVGMVTKTQVIEFAHHWMGLPQITTEQHQRHEKVLAWIDSENVEIPQLGCHPTGRRPAYTPEGMDEASFSYHALCARWAREQRIVK